MPRPTRNARAQARGPCGAKLITALRRIQAQKVVDLDALRAGTQDFILLTGLPDIASSRPHAPSNT